MRFSETFQLTLTDADDWFDPLLSTDTPLFVDPFRIYSEKSGVWKSAHSRLIAFFNLTLGMLAEAQLRPDSSHWHAVQRLYLFREPFEFCLGYSEGHPFGAGAGRGLQVGMLDGAARAIREGVHDVKHFEELTLFEGGFGPDRISDVVCDVLKKEFVTYTQAVANRHNIEVHEFRVRQASWSDELRRWSDDAVLLPRNPYTDRGILLTPKRFLRDLPSVDPEEFWEFAWSSMGSQLRADFNYDIARRIDRQQIARLARRRPKLVRAYVESLEQGRPKPAYDFDSDPRFAVRWYDAGASITAAHPLSFIAKKKPDFCEFLEQLLKIFVHYVEEEGGWRLLWNGDRPRAERDVQLLFRGILIHYCRAYGIDLSGEANAGRGPVDFKFSQGWESRALLEIKLTNNSAYWDGLAAQLPQYMESELIECGYFLSVGFREVDFTAARQKRVIDAVSAARRVGKKVRPITVDAREKESASKLRAATRPRKARIPKKKR